MKKLLILVLSLVAVISLVACTDDEVQAEVVTIRYAAQNAVQEGSPELVLIREFEKLHENIKVEVLDGTGNIIEKLTTWVTEEEGLPDLFFNSDLPQTHKNDWILDVTSLITADAEYQNVAADIRNASKIGAGIYGIPSGIFYNGYFVDKTLFENANLDAPTYGQTIQQVLNVSKTLAKQVGVKDGSGISGIRIGDDMALWLMAQVNDGRGFYTYNPTTGTVSLTDQIVADSIALQKSLLAESSYTWEGLNSLSNDDKIAMFGGNGNANDQARIGVFSDWTWAMGGYASGMANQTSPRYNHEFDFIGLPSYNGVNKNMFTMDFLSIAKTSKHVDAAWALAKFIGYGKEGYLKRLELAKEDAAFTPNFPPLQNDATLLNQYFELYPTFTEYRKLITNHTAFFNEGLGKVVPGWSAARWSATYGVVGEATVSVGDIVWRSINSDYVWADYVVQLNTVVNKTLADARAALGI
ncbi:MAG: ABC transporter substrate-binding protein [Acholeplasmatales bacterium]|jgi:ABC-type glycerol-3-phosphate transport system substrate-binding protein|nr:ABC transporter substrate-binding protein [Acholeplasmatales bacterium]